MTGSRARSKAHVRNLHSEGLSATRGSAQGRAEMRVSRGGAPGTMLAAFTMMASAAFAFTPVSPPLSTRVVGSGRTASFHRPGVNAGATHRRPMLAAGRGPRRASLAPPLRMSSPGTSVAEGSAAPEEGGNKPTRHFTDDGFGAKPFRIVLIAGFETFNRYGRNSMAGCAQACARAALFAHSVKSRTLCALSNPCRRTARIRLRETKCSRCA